MGCIESTKYNEQNWFDYRQTSKLNVKQISLSKCISRSSRKHCQMVIGVNYGKLSLSSKLLLNPPFSSISQFTKHLYLTGLAGLTNDNIQINHIGCIINLAEEAQCLFKHLENNILYYEFKLPESQNASIYEQFDPITDLINKIIQENKTNVVIDCITGMSRSSTIVLAYAVKHLKKTLKESFQHLQKIRPYARPNLNYFNQLVDFERKCHRGANTITMVPDPDNYSPSKNELTRKSPKKIIKKLKIPDIYLNEYSYLHKLEISIQMEQYHEPNQYTGELRPFIIEPISYKMFVEELEQSRNNSH